MKQVVITLKIDLTFLFHYLLPDIEFQSSFILHKHDLHKYAKWKRKEQTTTSVDAGNAKKSIKVEYCS